jgi:hypothetical protein
MAVTLLRPTSTSQVLRTGETRTATFAGISDTRAFTFTAATGQRLVVERSKATTPTTLTVTNATGAVLSSDGDGTVSPLWLPETGPLTLSVRPTAPGVGVVDVTGWLVTDPTVAMQGTQTFAWSPYQNPRLTFPAGPGERIILDVTGASFSGPGPVTASLDTPDGATIPMGVITAGTATFVEAQQLTTSAGTYTINLYTGVRTHGSVTATVRRVVDKQVSGRYGKPTQASVTQPGTNVLVAMPVTTAATLSYRATGVTFGAATVRFVDDLYGVEWASVNLLAGTSSGTVAASPYGGPYHVVVDPTGTATGTATVTIRTP